MLRLNEEQERYLRLLLEMDGEKARVEHVEHVMVDPDANEVEYEMILELARAGALLVSTVERLEGNKAETTTVVNKPVTTSYARTYFGERDAEDAARRELRWSDRRFSLLVTVLTCALSVCGSIVAAIVICNLNLG